MANSKKQSLEDALKSVTQDKPIVENIKLKENKVANRQTMRKLIVEINEEAHYQIHQLRLDLKKGSIKELVYEALNDVFKKYNKPPIL